MSERTFNAYVIKAEWRGEKIMIWNQLTVRQEHQLGHDYHESSHTILIGDGSIDEQPEFITPEIADKLRTIDVYPNARVIDPTDEEVTVL